LQSWKVPGRALSSLLLRRQPVSPTTTMRTGSAFTGGSARPSTLAARTPAGSTASQVSTGKADGFDSSGREAVGRWATVSAGARSRIGSALPSACSVWTRGGRRDDARHRGAVLAEQHEIRRCRRGRHGRGRPQHRARRQQHSGQERDGAADNRHGNSGKIGELTLFYRLPRPPSEAARQPGR
jgi:hypothetical protein